ncbi:histidine kinase [Streptococcus porcinus]|uniref:histidine kinase n=1 Tax=Streptococcus porcinus TaxID=1340 RepID=A0A4U9XTK1_STRPO|nr:HAMP domain-containing sensor histidine kinase [Streptococcus porcinus]MBA2796218.1 HAMP domain-containing histidine kinase [Streptococcus porcinus]VTS17063.1 histidine kinase [Streptococcus porcinus]
MKNKEALTLYIWDNITLFITVISTQLFFFGVLFYIKGIQFKETLYFSCLVFITLIVYLTIRYYKMGRLYHKLLLRGQILNDYFIEEPRSRVEEQYNSMIESLIAQQNKTQLNYNRDKKLQKMLVYRFIHQMKTPVSVLNLICENHRSNQDFEKISRNLMSIQYNLNQMLDAYKIEEFKNDFVTEKVLLNDICKESINNLKDYFINFGVYPKLSIKEGTYVYSDSKWIKLVLNQLLTNAIKYSHRGQTVLIEVTRVDGNIQLSIKDRGIGIKSAELKKIFDLFYVGENGRNNADSSGIGLYIVKKVINYLGHDLQVESKLNEGSSFTIKF